MPKQKTTSRSRGAKDAALPAPRRLKRNEPVAHEALEVCLVEQLSLQTLPEDEVQKLPAAVELEELGPRRGVPLAPGSVRLLVQFFRESAREQRTSLGLAWHNQGTRLRLLYGRKADVVLGYDTFEAFLRHECHIGRTTAFARMRFARDLTETEATYYGNELGALGIELMAMLGKKRIGDLEGLELAVPPASGGGTVIFTKDANAALVGPAVRSLEAKLLTEKEAKGRRAGVLTVVADRLRDKVSRATEKSPVLARLQVKVFVYAEEIRVTNRSPKSAKELAALGSLFRTLAKTPGF